MNKNTAKFAKGAAVVAAGLVVGNFAIGQAGDIQNLSIPLRVAEGLFGAVAVGTGMVKGGIMVGVGAIGMLRGREESTSKGSGHFGMLRRVASKITSEFSSPLDDKKVTQPRPVSASLRH